MKYQQLVAMPASVQDWLDHELEMRGIDAVVYTRYILSILQQENCDGELASERELFPGVTKRNLKEPPVGKSKGKSMFSADRSKCEAMKKSAAVECLMSVSEQKCGIEKLVDELCDKLKNIQGNGTLKNDLHNEKLRDEKTTIDICSLASSSLQEQAENYAAFPHLSGIIEPSAEPDSLNHLENNTKKLMWDVKSPPETDTVTKDNVTKEANERNELEVEVIGNEVDRKLLASYVGLEGFGSKLDDFAIRYLPQFEKMAWEASEKKGDLGGGKLCKNVLGLSNASATATPSFQWSQKRNCRKNVERERTEEKGGERSCEDVSTNLPEVKDYEIVTERQAGDDDGESRIESGDGEADLLAKLAAKFNDDVASIWSDQHEQSEESKSVDDIWKVLPFCGGMRGEKEQALDLKGVGGSALNYGPEYVWPSSVGKALFLEVDEKSPEPIDCNVAVGYRSSRESLFDSDNDCDGIGCYNAANEPVDQTQDLWKHEKALLKAPKSDQWNKEFYSSLATLEINCSSSQPDVECAILESEIVDGRSPSSKEDEMQLIWEVLGNLGNALHSDLSLTESTFNSNLVDGGRLYGKGNESICKGEWSKLKDRESCECRELRVLDVQMIWNSSEIGGPPYEPFGPSSIEHCKDMWPSEEADNQLEIPSTRSYDSYLSKMYGGGEGEEGAVTDRDGDSVPSQCGEPVPSPKKCTLTYHKGESCFVEVKPSCRTKWGNGSSVVPLHVNLSNQPLRTSDDYDSEDNGENLLTSPKTHFRPIRQDSCETDTTGSSDVGEEPVHEVGDAGGGSSPGKSPPQKAPLRKEMSPIFLTGCGDEESSDESIFLPICLSKSDNSEKFCQTDDLGSGDPTAVNGDGRDSETGGTEDSCTRILNAVIDVLDSMLGGQDLRAVSNDDGEMMNLTDTNSSSTSVSPPSSHDDRDGISSPSPSSPKMPASLASKFQNPLSGMWNAIGSQEESQNQCGGLKWSTAPDEDREEILWLCGDAVVAATAAPGAASGTANPMSWCDLLGDGRNGEKRLAVHESDKVKALRDEMREEEEKLFEDINSLRSLDLIKDAGEVEDRREEASVAAAEWMESQFGLKLPGEKNGKNDECCLELAMIHQRERMYSSSDGDEGIGMESTVYSDYLLELQKVESFVDAKLPAVPNSKVLYSTDLEKEWRKSGESLDVPTKSKCKQKSAYLKRPCSFYLEGNCRRSDCKFSHDLASITCRFWEEGSCFKGATCPFLHGYHRDKSEEEKPDFKLELESEAHFPALSKPKFCHRKKEFVQSSSSDSTPITKSKRQRKRFSSGSERNSSPAALKPTKPSRQAQKSKRSLKSSSSDDDLMDI